MAWFVQLSPIIQAAVAGIFCWAVAAAGSSLVFFTQRINSKLIDSMEGFASGVMIAACYWSLLAPAIEMTGKSGGSAWMPAAIGFLSGGLFLWGCDKILPHLHPGLPIQNAEGMKTGWSSNVLLVLAIILSDMRMDNETGIELVEWVRLQKPPLRDIAILILTGSASPLQMESAMTHLMLILHAYWMTCEVPEVGSALLDHNPSRPVAVHARRFGNRIRARFSSRIEVGNLSLKIPNKGPDR